MIPSNRIAFVTVEDSHVEAHVARARGDGKDVVDLWPDGSHGCTCYAFMVLGQSPCPHIHAVKANLPTQRTAGAS